MLFLIRHAHAVAASENPDRPLSPRGLADCARLAQFFQRNGLLCPAQVWHSPLTRSRETAARLFPPLGIDPLVLETSGLLPEDDPEPMSRRIDDLAEETPVAVVGHEPHLGHLASLLIRGKATPVIVDFKKSAILALERTSSRHAKTGTARWRVRWLLTPALLGPVATPALPPPPP
jgi:phosphohistidine phosphatase